ncbi:MAG: hypothetical protein HYY16_03895 [Planctomycetes bacterium]|nr:hypothetical protein [Planctomycetota bacterium]
MKRTIFTFGILTLAACGQVGKPADSPLREKAVFQDVPVPEGLTYDAGTGRTTPAGNIRVYTQEFSGNRKLEDIVTFYRQTLPLHGWSLSGEEGKDPVKLVFLKKDEQCVVNVASHQGGVKVGVKLDYKP